MRSRSRIVRRSCSVSSEGETNAEIARRIGRHRVDDRPGDRPERRPDALRAHRAQERADEAAAGARPVLDRDPAVAVGRGAGAGCGQKWSPEQIAGRLRATTPTIHSGGCRTRRSTRRSSCRPRASCARSWPRACARGGPGAGPEGRVRRAAGQDRRDGQHLRTARRGRGPGRARPLGRRPDHRRQRQPARWPPWWSEQPGSGMLIKLDDQDRRARRRPARRHIVAPARRSWSDR